MSGKDKIIKINKKLDDHVNYKNVEKLREKKQAAAEKAKEEDDWTSLMNAGKDQAPKTNSVHNVIALLNYDPIFKDKFKFNTFTQEIEITEDTSFMIETDTHHNIKKGSLDDREYAILIAYFDAKYQLCFPLNIFSAGLQAVAQAHSYNPLQDYIDEQIEKWDGKSRYKDLLPDFLGAEKTPLTAKTTLMFLLGLVAKIYAPETKFDYVLDLIGGQGVGKTTLLQKIAPLGYYTDQFTTFTDKDDYANMLKNILINDDEMTATDNSTFQELKKFISARFLEYRPPYGRKNIKRDKSFVMARTSNDIYYLKDKTGNRRFMPVLCGVIKNVKSVFKDLTPEYVDQLWGEIGTIYKKLKAMNKLNFEFNKEDEELIEKNRQQFMYVDEVEEEVDLALQTLIKTSKFKENHFITASDIALRMGIANLTTNTKVSRKINYIMQNKDGWKYTRRMIDGRFKRGYIFKK